MRPGMIKNRNIQKKRKYFRFKPPSDSAKDGKLRRLFRVDVASSSWEMEERIVYGNVV